MGRDSTLKIKMSALAEMAQANPYSLNSMEPGGYKPSLSQGYKINKSAMDESSLLHRIVSEHSISTKLAISSCKAVAKEHFVLRYSFETEAFELLPLAPIRINGQLLKPSATGADADFVRIKALDQLELPCHKCYMPHLFYVVQPEPQDQQQSALTSQMREQLVS